jgi:hypothetical protein
MFWKKPFFKKQPFGKFGKGLGKGFGKGFGKGCI